MIENRNTQYFIQAESERAAIQNVCTYGMDFLNDTLLGIHPSELILLSAPTGDGKSGIFIEILKHNLSEGKKVAYCSLEGRDSELGNKLTWDVMNTDTPGHFADYTYDHYTKGFIPQDVLGNKSNEATAKVNDLCVNLVRRPLVIEPFKISIMTQWCNSMKLEEEVDLIMIDHYDYVKSDYGSKGEFSHAENVMHALLGFSQTAHIPTMINAHLRKPGENSSRMTLFNIYDVKGAQAMIGIPRTIIMFQRFECQVLDEKGHHATIFKIPKGYKHSGYFLKMFDGHSKKYFGGYAMVKPYFHLDEKRNVLFFFKNHGLDESFIRALKPKQGEE